MSAIAICTVTIVLTSLCTFIWGVATGMYLWRWRLNKPRTGAHDAK